jgi:protein SCO1/2
MKLRDSAAASLLAAATLALALVLAACGSDPSDGESGDDDAAAVVTSGSDPEGGTVLDTPFAKPELVLTDTEGEPFDLAADTAGYATLLYFGYTNCPDVCPLTMSNIAIGAAELAPEQRERLRVVMVTSDPERDTPEELGAWLRAQDPEFIGLTGDFDEIQAAARSVGVHLEEPYEEADGTVVSTHGSQVIAFLPDDDRGRVLYTEGVTADTFIRDLPGLIEGKTP